MDLKLKGKRALVTGSNAGLGEAIARMLAPYSDYVSGAIIRVDGGTVRSIN